MPRSVRPADAGSLIGVLYLLGDLWQRGLYGAVMAPLVLGAWLEEAVLASLLTLPPP